MAKNKIEIRGVIVPSDYDVDWLFSYIKRGIITPESRVRTLIDEADTSKDIELYINSPGGSVFAGNEMMNALMDWQVTTGKKINITIGAMAASMGSAILVTLAGLGNKVKVHANSKSMFHGAWGMQIGGAEAMKDYSELLDKINSDIKVKLIQNYSLSADVVNEWFKEGREGWLNASEMLGIGMADEIIGQDADMPETVDGLEGILNTKGMKIAALTINKLNGEIQMKEWMKKMMAKLKLADDASETDVMTAIENEMEKGEKNASIKPSSEAGSGKNAGEGTTTTTTESGEGEGTPAPAGTPAVSEYVKALQEKVEGFEEKIKSLNGALNKKQSELDKLKSEHSKLQSKHEKLVGNGILFESDTDAPTDWKSCLAACDGDYVAARKAYPEAYKTFMKSEKNK